MIYYIVLRRTRKKLSCCNENIQSGCFKKLGCGIKRKLKFNGANNCFRLPYLPKAQPLIWDWSGLLDESIKILII